MGSLLFNIYNLGSIMEFKSDFQNYRKVAAIPAIVAIP